MHTFHPSHGTSPARLLSRPPFRKKNSHLAGLVVGYLTAWGFLPSTPVIAGLSVIFMIQRSQAWARKMPSYSLLLEGWAGGEANRVGRARMMGAVILAQV